jgi:hypothetical protein
MVFPFAAAIVVFCIVQDRVTAAGARRYVQLQQAAAAGADRAATLDEVMRPAIRDSVRQGLLWGAVAFLGAGGVVLVVRRSGRE